MENMTIQVQPDTNERPHPSAGPLMPEGNWQISGWTGEFRDREVEASYLTHNQQVIGAQARMALLVWAALVMLFAVPEYHAMGATFDFGIALLARTVTALVLVGFAWMVDRRPILATRALWISLIELGAITLFLMTYVMRPELAAWTVTLTLIMIIAMFIFVPNRVPAVLAVSFYMALGTTAMVHYVNPKTPAELTALMILLVVPILVGWGAAVRTQVLQRKQYSMWRKAERYNEILSHEMEERARLQDALMVQATTDPLTGLNNRRQYERLFGQEIARADRKKHQLALCIIDLDHFKQVNDTWGHSAGDKVLKAVAELCRANFRTIDIIGRLGGEEFVVLLPDTDLATALHIAGRVLQRLADTPISIGDQAIHLTATAGVVERQPDEMTLESLVQRADAAMYRGKKAGRNQVVAG
jgi:diguanylate cyclase